MPPGPNPLELLPLPFTSTELYLLSPRSPSTGSGCTILIPVPLAANSPSPQVLSPPLQLTGLKPAAKCSKWLYIVPASTLTTYLDFAQCSNQWGPPSSRDTASLRDEVQFTRRRLAPAYAAVGRAGHHDKFHPGPRMAAVLPGLSIKSPYG